VVEAEAEVVEVGVAVEAARAVTSAAALRAVVPDLMPWALAHMEWVEMDRTCIAVTSPRIAEDATLGTATTAISPSTMGAATSGLPKGIVTSITTLAMATRIASSVMAFGSGHMVPTITLMATTAVGCSVAHASLVARIGGTGTMPA